MKLVTLLFIVFTLVGCASGENIRRMSTTAVAPAGAYQPQHRTAMLPSGSWEGILRSTGEFMVLTIDDSGQHSLTSYNIASGMQYHETITFSDDAITCDDFNCTIKTRTALEQLPRQVSLTPTYTGFYVTESVKLDSGENYTTTYKLTALEASPTPERFIANNTSSIMLIAAKHKTDRFGFWSGILEYANEDTLRFATLNYQPGKDAVFTVYLTGAGLEARMTFKPEWLTQNNGELSTRLEGARLASALTIRYALRDVIDGDFEQRFDRYPERLVAHGNFKLYRVTLPEDRKLPEWLKAYLDK